MNISARNVSFGYAGKPLFDNFSAVFDGGASGRPLMILGPSGCGKTTLLKLLGGLLKPSAGEVVFSEGNRQGAAFMFQESRLLPWKNVLENVSLPLEKIFGAAGARERARRFLSLVTLADKEDALPKELSGGEAQRVSMARAFAWPAPALFMDEPFQSLDIPLRKNLMDLTLSLLEKEPRLIAAVTHDPREAVYMSGRIIVLGRAGKGIVFDRAVTLSAEERRYGSVSAGTLEREVIAALELNSAET